MHYSYALLIAADQPPAIQQAIAIGVSAGVPAMINRLPDWRLLYPQHIDVDTSESPSPFKPNYDWVHPF